jgi:hypothetical protein
LKLERSLPELPWEAVQRLTDRFGADKRDVETLLSLDEYNVAGLLYLEEVVQGDTHLGKKALNWCVPIRSLRVYDSPC